MERVVPSGLSALRWAAAVWMVTVLALTAHQLARPWLAYLLVGAAVAFTAVATAWTRHDPARLFSPAVVSTELAIAAALVVSDGWAYGPHHAFSSSQPLGSVWPLVSVLSVGAGLGVRYGMGAGLLLGAGRLGAALANGVRHFDSAQALSLANSAVYFMIAGAVAGYVAALLRRAERQISAARAREEVARTLHDGVLQTLAVVERRSTDGDLVRLAREQDRELRAYLYGDRFPVAGADDLGAALRRAAGRFEDAFGIRADVVVADDVPALDRRSVEAVSGAVGEALANAGKHARASRVTVFAEPAADGRRLFCSVKDDGDGFDPGGGSSGVGIPRSIMGRMREVGGSAEVRSRPGGGTEVCLWL